MKGRLKNRITGNIFYAIYSSMFLSIMLFIFSTCSFSLFRDFTVTSISIDENGVIGTGLTEIMIHFSEDVDPESARIAIRIDSDCKGEVSLKIDVSGNMVVLKPYIPWEPHDRFWLIVEKELQNIHGEELGEDFYRCFQSTSELFAISAELIRPRITGGTVEEFTDRFEIVFSGGVIPSSVERAFYLSPETEGYFEWTSSKSFTYHLLKKLNPNCHYTLNIEDGAQDADGFDVEVFHRNFEYYPNQPYPEIERIYASGIEIFDKLDPSSYSLEGGIYLIETSGIEKDLVLRFDFSKPVECSSFANSINVSPFVEWHESWIDERVVEIYFAEPLKPDERYHIRVRKGMEDIEGLSLLYEYYVLFSVDGENSKFLEFYAESFSDLKIEASDLELWVSGAKVNDGVQVVEVIEPSENNNEGFALCIDYDEEKIGDVSEVEVRFVVPLIFMSLSYTPVVDQRSLQDSIMLQHIAGDRSFSGSIFSFEWVGINECRVRFGEMGAGGVYHFSINGRQNGVFDSRGNYLEDDINYFFKVLLVEEL
ncbi:MAG: Ig-like domain-containing protein [Spirochaetota bacterium]